MQHQNTLQAIPKKLRKQDIYRLYGWMSTAKLRKIIHWIQKEVPYNCPGITEEEAKRMHSLNAKQVEKLFEELGAPEGYREPQ